MATRRVAQLDGCDGWQAFATSTNGMFVDGVRLAYNGLRLRAAAAIETLIAQLAMS